LVFGIKFAFKQDKIILNEIEKTLKKTYHFSFLVFLT